MAWCIINVLSQKHSTLILVEEIFNSITHGLAFFLVGVGLVILFVFHGKSLTLIETLGVSIFGASLLILYSTSTLYHSLYKTRAKTVFIILDHAAIYILIAGTYTPIIFSVLNNLFGWIILSIIWALAIGGVILKSFIRERFAIVSNIIYLFMGWLIVIAINPIFHAIPFQTFLLLVAGGLFYSFGIIFFILKKIPFNHTVWHLFVVAGSLCHFLVIFEMVTN